MDRFSAMETFVAVVDAGSFVRAADRLGISTSATSRLVSELEAHLNARLLHRTTRRLTLTDAGRVYYEQCQALLADLADAEAMVSRQSDVASGVLRISAPVSFGIRHLAPVLPHYHREQPEVKLDLSLNDRVVDLAEEGHDLAIRIRDKLATTLVARPLAPVRIVLCASPDYLARHGTPRTPDDLAEHQCLLYSYTEAARHWQFASPGGTRRTVEVGGFLCANNGDVLREAALAGEGICRQPSFLVGDDLLAGRLVPLLSEFPQPSLTAYAVYLSRRHLSAKVRTFVDFLAGAWGNPPPWDAWMKAPPARG